MHFLFVTFEGIDGSGKSTLAENVWGSLSKILGKGRILKTHEPGGWSGGEAIRTAIISGRIESSWGEVLLFLADRCEHVERVIRPSLKKKMIVLCERFTDSTIAYQSYGRGFPKRILEDITSLANVPTPDMTFWIDLSVDLANERILSRKAKPDRFEKDTSLLERISRGYESIYLSNVERVVRLDGRLSTSELTEETVFKIMNRFEV